jgi:sugar phosphate isomerase/epimerase
MPAISRRNFLAVAGASALATGLRPDVAFATQLKSPFRVAVITDEVSQDFDHACSVASREFGLDWVELRGMWNKNLQNLDDAEIATAQKILEKYNLRVTDIASPLFKVDWPGAPRSKFSPKGDTFAADFTFKQQVDVMQKSIALARQFKTDRVRCFDFWRLDDPAPYRIAITAKLTEAAEACGKQGILLILENELDCNTATGAEAAKTLAAIQSPHFMLNWDPGNAVARGEVRAFPDGWNALPKNRIGHCHCKSATQKPDGGFEWAPVGQGLVDWTAQFRALKQIGYKYAVSLETHWRGAGTPEESSRISMAGMKKALEQAGALA